MTNQFSLLATRRFLPLFATQFFGAFNDNVFKSSLVVLLTYHAQEWTSLNPLVLANLGSGIFILPFFLFSASAGQLADKFDRAKIARIVKILEIGIMILAGIGFLFHGLAILFFALFLMGVHSTLFGPVKYALLPQLLQEDELVGGNALVESGTFAAILLGTLLGTYLAASGSLTFLICVPVGIAILGYLASRFIPNTSAPMSQLRFNFNLFTSTWQVIGFAKQTRAIFLSILGISWFWAYGALFLAQFPYLAKSLIGGSEDTFALLLMVFVIGVSFGSLICEKLSRHKVEVGLVPLGAMGLTLFGLIFAWHLPSEVVVNEHSIMTILRQGRTWWILLDLFLIGAFGGIYCVPLYALIQQRSTVEYCARIVAANNIVNALFVVVGSLVAAWVLGKKASLSYLFAGGALINGLVAIYIFKQAPEYFSRFVSWIQRNAKT